MSKQAKLIYEDLTYKIRGSVFNVYNELGFGHKEVIYQKALIQEFTDNNLNYISQPSIPVYYKGKKMGFYKPDFLIDNKVIIEIKSLEFMPAKSQKQLMHYLKGTKYKLGLLINFGGLKLDIRRVIWDIT